MRPVLFEVPGLGLKVFGFGTMVVAAFFAAVGLAAWRARREKLDPELVYDLSAWMVLGGLIGARAFYVAQHPESVLQVWDVFKLWRGGIVFYGCAMGATAAFAMRWARRPFPLRPMLDVIAPAVALGLGLGRVGCFLNGCCFGDACHLPWAVRFPAGSFPWADQVDFGQIPRWAPRSLPVHPTQLYSAINGLMMLALLSAYYPLRRRDGEVMGLLLIAYPVTRFLIERLRGDEGIFFAGMTVSQNISILLFLAGLAYWFYLTRLPPGRYADSADQPAEERATGPAPVPAI
jgi:phosphatidylglycerol:prolipoprotein diacylglycerol transferase